jgi:hypothetical protein
MGSVAAVFPGNAVERDETLNRELLNAKPEQLGIRLNKAYFESGK